MKQVAVALAVALLAIAPRPISQDVAAALGDDAGGMVRLHQAPSVSVAVVENNAIAFAHVAGDATPDSVYAIGSVTKMFTAVSIFQLVDAGKVALDDPLAKFLPDFPNAANITVRQLLSHQAGINDYLAAAARDALVYHPTTSDALVALLAKATPQFAPGAGWQYSNGGYVLLGKIVERVTHQSLADYEREHVFKVAGMQQTDVGRAPAGLTLAPPFLSVGFYAKLVQPDYSWYYACGDILSTASDLARFDIALMTGKLVSNASFAAMQRVVVMHTLESNISDGLGLFTQRMADLTLVGHHGGEPGYTADNEMIPADGFAVVILDNGFAQTNDTLSLVLHALYQSPAAAPVAQATPPPEFAAALKAFQSFFNSLQASSLDRSVITDAMDTQLTPDVVAQESQYFRPWGAIERVAYQGQSKVGAFTVYVVQLVCANGPHIVKFSIENTSGKVGGFFPAG